MFMISTLLIHCLILRISGYIQALMYKEDQNADYLSDNHNDCLQGAVKVC